jgi:RNA polymerase sigma-70 factor (ECF subfamily)
MMTSSRNDKRSRNGPDAERLRRLGDPDCLVLARNGDRAAQAELVDRHLPVVYRLCLRWLGDRDDAADASQEVFLRALGALRRVETKGSFRAWLCTIAWNLLRDRGRRARVRKIVADGTATFDPEDPKGCTPLEILAEKEKRELLTQALNRLAPTVRAVLVLRDVEDLSYGELAVVLGCRIGTAKSRVHRARVALKNAMKALQPAWFEE